MDTQVSISKQKNNGLKKGPISYFDKFIKRWSAAESFTIFENQVYCHQKNLTFAINFVATPFLGGSSFSDYTQAKVCLKFGEISIFGRKSNNLL